MFCECIPQSVKSRTNVLQRIFGNFYTEVNGFFFASYKVNLVSGNFKMNAIRTKNLFNKSFD